MKSIPGYQIISQLTETASMVLYRGIRMTDDHPVVIKTSKGDLPDARTLAQLHHAYAVAGDITTPGVIKHYELVKSSNTVALIMEFFSQTTLKQVIASKQLDLKLFFTIAIQLTKILDEIHRLQIFHKDIKPDNILFHPDTKEVKLTDFGIATRLTIENSRYSNPRMVEGSLEYISPEQTGRMNRAIDYRTDYYSLGVTFYQMLTRRLPFEASDPIALVHCHLAKQAVPPNQIEPKIPKPVSDMIMKLMLKNAEDRYQTAHGIEADLVECQNQFESSGQITSFKVGQFDISDKFHIPQKLYGRENEIEDLLNAFERINRAVPSNQQVSMKPFSSENYLHHSSKAEMILVAGYSGIGKSVLVQEIHKSIVSLRGYYSWGKFDQYKRDIPYLAIIQAFSELVRQILTETNTELDSWRTEILEALGPNGQIIIDVIPALERIIGPQPAVPELAPIEAQNRFNFVFRKFLRVFASQKHPLVVFLDDLQWADSASLKLIHTFITDPETSHLLLIGAYRDNEVSSGHPLVLTLDDIRKAGITVNTILLKPLDLHHINHLIVDTLNVEIASARPLAELIYSKTYGNPFFVNQFLTMLYTEGLLVFIPPDHDENWGWRWDFKKIQELAITDNVVDLMVSKLQKLSDDTLNAIKLAACYGNRFDLESLSIVNEKSPKETAASLWEAVKKGLVYPVSDLRLTMLLTRYDTITEDTTSTESHDSKIYQFLHDRVQQAAYTMIPSEEKPNVHLKIGRLLLKKTAEAEREDIIFDIVNHINTGVRLIKSQTEKTELAKLNLLAGKKAKLSTAYQSAFSYLTIGISLLHDAAWHQDYDLILGLYIEAVETAFLSGDFKEMDRLAQIVLNQAQQLLDKVKIYEVIIQSKTARNQMLEALDTALSVLALLGVKLPKYPNKFQIIKALIKTKILMAGKEINDLRDLPEMTDPEKLAAMQILSHINTAAYVAIPELLAVSVFQQVILSIKFGNAALSAYAYSSYGAILCGVIGDIDTGYQFAQLAVKLAEHPKARKYKSRTLMVANALALHWKDHSRDLIPNLLEAYQCGLETGDQEYAALSLLMYILQSYLNGRNLNEIEPEMEKYSLVIKELKQETIYNYIRMYHQSTLNLIHPTINPGRLEGDRYNESKMLKVHEKANDRTAFEMLYYHKLILNYHFQKFHPAVECSIISEKDVDAAMGVFAVPAFYFYDSLARLAICQVTGKTKQIGHRLKVAKNQRKMKKWARFSNDNHFHKYMLVEAERARVKGKVPKAMEYYDIAIHHAQKNNYIQEQALANELAARFYLSLGRDIVARTYLIHAKKLYHQWGAIAKVNDLDSRYANLLSFDNASQYPLVTEDKHDNTVMPTSSSTALEELDLASVMKASQAISGEIVLARLMDKLMEIVIENAGAQKGFLILDASTINFHIEGDTPKSSSLYICQSDTFVPLEKSTEVSHAIINYVIRNNESLVLNDAVSEGDFIHDTYVVRNRPKSVLCMPIMRHFEITGILYLENNEATGAFTSERVQVLQILAAQAAISIENATLYSSVEKQAAYIENIIKSMLDTLIVVNLDGSIMTVNRAMLDLTGYAQNEMVGKSIDIILSDEEKIVHQQEDQDDDIQLPGVFGKLLHQKAITNYEMYYRTKKGELIPVNFSGSVMTDKNNHIICIVAIARDIRELRDVMAQLIQAEKLTALGELTAGVAHELKQPLNVIKIIGQSIVRDIEKQRVETEYLEKDLQDIILQVNKMAEIIDHMRVFTRFSGEMQKMEIHVNDLMESLFKLFSQQLKNHNVDLTKVLANDLPYVMGDSIRIEQVMMNLVTNARHAVEKSQNETKTIEVSTYLLSAKDSPLRDKTVVIQISDNGGGIPEHLEEKIFEQFFTTRTAGEGTGLGLSISKKIIEEHKGKILLDNNPGFGATFKVLLPAHKHVNEY